MKNKPNRKATTGGYLGGARDVVSGRVGAEQRVVQNLPVAAQLRAAFNSKVSARECSVQHHRASNICDRQHLEVCTKGKQAFRQPQGRVAAADADNFCRRMMIGSGNGRDLPEPGTHAEIVLADGGGAPGDALVLVLKHLRARQPPPVVQHAATFRGL